MTNNMVLVTGGAGFLGSCLVKKLLTMDREVVVYDNFFTGKQEFLPKSAHLHVVEGTILDVDGLKSLLQKYKPSAVYHLAALHYIPYCNANPTETVNVNVGGTQSLIEACSEFVVERLIFASTAAVYAINEQANSEDHTVLPLDIYGATKYFGEHLVRLYQEKSSVPCRVARLFNIYGPNETNDHVIPAILGQLMRGPKIKLGNLEPKRDYIYVEDVAEALMVLENNCTASFDKFNVGSGKEYSVCELIDVIRESTGKTIQVEQEASRTRKTDRLHLLANITKIKDATGWQPKYSVHKGLKALIARDYGCLIGSE